MSIGEEMEYDDGSEIVEALDREIAELQLRREKRKRLLADPEERPNRALRREQLSGRWAVRQALDEASLAEIRELSGDEGSLWARDFMEADGWVEDSGVWRLGCAVGG